jgi:branched-chain amino acid transport system substrate-binding protein
MGSETQMAINAATKDLGIPFISCSQSNEIGKAESRGQYTFHEAITPHMTSSLLAKWGYENLGSRWAWLLMDHPWAVQGYESSMEFLTQYGGTDAGMVKAPFGGSVEDYEKTFDQLLSFKADVISVRAFGRDQTNFIKAAARRGLKREAPIMIGISETHFVDTLPLDDLVGIYWATNFYWGLEQTIPSAKKFVSAFRQRFNGEVPSGYAGYAYAGMKEALIALAESSYDGTSYEGMKEFLEGRHYDHYKGAQWWRPCDHQSFQDLYILRFKGPEESREKQDMAELMGTVSWDLSIERTCQNLGYK